MACIRLLGLICLLFKYYLIEVILGIEILYSSIVLVFLITLIFFRGVIIFIFVKLYIYINKRLINMNFVLNVCLLKFFILFNSVYVKLWKLYLL